MVTYYNRGDLIKFGDYLLSEERKQSFSNHPEPPKGHSLELRLSRTDTVDIDNWQESLKKK